MSRVSSCGPLFHPQTRHARELAGVRGHQQRATPAYLRGDKHVTRVSTAAMTALVSRQIADRRQPGFRHSASKTRVNALKAQPGQRVLYLLVARSKNFISAARSCAEPMRCSGILVPGV